MGNECAVWFRPLRRELEDGGNWSADGVSRADIDQRRDPMVHAAEPREHSRLSVLLQLFRRVRYSQDGEQEALPHRPGFP